MKNKKIIWKLGVLVSAIMVILIGATACASAHNSKTTSTNEKILTQKANAAVTASMEKAMEFDRYEYATGDQHGKKVLCFYAGTESIRYSSNIEENMDITKNACAYSYSKYIQALTEGLPWDAEVNVTRYEMVNVYGNTAYIYDFVTGEMDVIVPATGLKSVIKVETTFDKTKIKQTWTFIGRESND